MLLNTVDTKQDEVTAFSTLSGYMQRPEVGTDFFARFDADGTGACTQRLQC